MKGCTTHHYTCGCRERQFQHAQNEAIACRHYVRYLHRFIAGMRDRQTRQVKPIVE